MTHAVLPDNLWSGLTGWSSATMSAVGGCMQACSEACVGWQQEIARFSQERLVENQRTWAALLSSRDVAAIVKAQHEWGVQAATDYTRETTRLARFATSFWLTGTTPSVQATANINA